MDGSEVRTCSACGAEVPDGRSVCPQCGVLQRSVAPPAPVAPPPAPLGPYAAPESPWADPAAGAAPAAPPAGFLGGPPVPGAIPGDPGAGSPPPPPGSFATPPPATQTGPLPPAPVAGAWQPVTSYAARPYTPPPAPPRSGCGIVAAIGVVLVALAVVAGVVVSNKQDDDAARRDATSTTTPRATTTTTPRVTDASALTAYCGSPGAKWNEVPRHVPTEPSRSDVHIDHGAAKPNGFDGSDVERSAVGGSTVISPHTDGRFISDPSVLARTRSVTCVRYLRTENVGRSCDYVGESISNMGTRTTLAVARNLYEVTVYELHSGGILHKGEIWTRTPNGCPDHAYVENASTVTFPLTDGDVLAWIGSHFVDGAPH